MAAKEFKFTVKALQGLTCPATGKPDKPGRLYAYDTEVPGLAYSVTEAGARAFYLVKSSNGKTKRYRLGAHDEMTIDQARKDAAHKTLQIRGGVDPLQEKKRERRRRCGKSQRSGTCGQPTVSACRRRKSREP